MVLKRFLQFVLQIALLKLILQIVFQLKIVLQNVLDFFLKIVLEIILQFVLVLVFEFVLDVIPKIVLNHVVVGRCVECVVCARVCWARCAQVRCGRSEGEVGLCPVKSVRHVAVRVAVPQCAPWRLWPACAVVMRCVAINGAGV